MLSKVILLAVYSDTHFVELERLANLLRHSNEFIPLFVFPREYPAIKRDMGKCQSSGYVCIESSTTTPLPFDQKVDTNISKPNKRYFPQVKGVGRSACATLRRAHDKLVSPYRSITGTYASQMHVSLNMLARHQVSLICICEDNVGYATSVLIKAGHSIGIPSVIVPYTIVGPSEAAEAIFDRPPHLVSLSWGNQIVAMWYRKWVYTHRGRRLLRLPVNDILAQEWLQLTPRQPWIVNSGYADAIAVESEAMLRHYQSQGLGAKRLKMVGALYDDVLADGVENRTARKASLYTELDLPSNRPLLLCAFPPSQFPRACEFTSYDELAEKWAQLLLSVTGWNVVIRLHPRVKYEDMLHLEEMGLRITQRDTASLVPLCDLYIASVSATIRWAIACGKPVLNYDVYRMGYTDYASAGGVITVDNQPDFSTALHRLTEESEYYQQVVHRQRQCMEQWGRLDGQAGQRMLGLFDELILSARNQRRLA